MTNKPGPVIRTLHRIVAIPALYEIVQRIAGRQRVAMWLAGAIPSAPAGIVLDVGSASGEHARQYAGNTVSLDIDIVPLIQRRLLTPGAMAVCGDAAKLPFRSGAVRTSFFIATSHHLSDDSLSSAFGELARVSSTQVVFMDAVRDNSLVSRILWRLDRGAYPRRPADLEERLARCFRVIRSDTLRVLHAYRVYVCVPKVMAGTDARTR